MNMPLCLSPAIASRLLTIIQSWLLALGAIALGACIVFFARCVYNATLHPLSRVPGPRLAACSNIWLALQAKHGRLGHLGRTLHLRYGSAVRVGPNEIWFDSKEAYKVIYSAGSGFEKSDFYLATALQRPDIDHQLNARSVDTLDLLSERDMKRYRLQRKLIGPVYRPTSVLRHEDKVDKVMSQVAKKLRSMRGAEVDLKEWMHIIVVECLGETVLSWSPGLLKLGTDGGTSAHGYRAWRRKTVLGLFPVFAKLEMCSKTIGRLFGVLWGVTFAPPPGFRAFFPYVGRRITKRIQMARQAKPASSPSDVAADLILLQHEKPEFTDIYLRKMIMTNFGAGHETMASTLTSIMAMLGTHPMVWERLAGEVRSHAGVQSYSAAASLPYLQAVIKETKRLHPVVATGLPRRVPEGGFHIHGVFIPAETTVGCNPIALHRNPVICGPDPPRFNPDRWFDKERAKDMEMYSLAWGGGARSCPGRHLAEMMVWKILVALVREFDLKVDTPDSEMMPSYFLSIMTGVKVRFIPHTPR